MTNNLLCNDTISREDVLDEINRLGQVGFKDYNTYSSFYDFVEGMPSVQPSRKGHWIYRRGDKYSCSKCGTTTSVDEGGIEEKPMYNFCPYCGAEMEQM